MQTDQENSIVHPVGEIAMTLNGASADLAALTLQAVFLQELLKLVGKNDKSKIADELAQMFEKSVAIIESSTFNDLKSADAAALRASAREQVRRVFASVRILES